MLKKIFLPLSLIGICATGLKAQTVNPCGTDEVYRKMVDAHPEIADINAQLSQEIAEKLSGTKIKDLSPFAITTEEDGTTVYHVPVVFHVIHDYGAEYLPDAAFVSCIEQVNRLYNKMNADTSGIIGPYKGFIHNSTTRYIGNARIEWHLATKDPLGNPTNGVTRRRSYLTKSAGDLAKYDQWPPSNYMNVWVINTMSASHSGAAAYAYKPATGAVIPYYDGVITLYNYVNSDNTIAHEFGHELNLDHVWGGTNNPEVACGDDEVDDTPPTKGHNSCIASKLYDTTCIFNYLTSTGKLRLDTITRADSPAYTKALKTDNSTSIGMSFKCRTVTTLDSFRFYPAVLGADYKIGLSRNGVNIDSISVTATSSPQVVKPSFRFPRADTSVTYKLFFIENPGAYRDTFSATSAISIGKDGTIFLTEFMAADNYYNFFYDWRSTYGYYKIYANDSLVDYPDTTNTQNIMEYAFCPNYMFTHGQTARMRAALTSSVARRDSLITPANLDRTGALATSLPPMKPKAELSVERAYTAGGLTTAETTPAHFMCASSSTPSYVFRLSNRTWRSTATSTTWDISNGATAVGTSGSYYFTDPGWAKVSVISENANGADTFVAEPGIYVADPNAINPIGYWQDFNDAAENAKYPIFNYYNNRYKWEIANDGGTYDGTAMRYRSYDDRTALSELVVGDPAGDHDDFFTPAFDLSVLGPDHGNINFMYAGAYATNNIDQMKDQLEIAYSTNCGGTWTTLKTMKNEEMQTIGSVPVSAGEYKPIWSDWKAMSIDLRTSGGALIRNDKVFFRFRYKPSSRPIGQYQFASGNNFYIDRINISNFPLTVNEMILGDKVAALAPNPTNADAYVLFTKPNANVKIDVVDITGKLVYSVSQKIDQINAKVIIPASQFGAKGIYMVRITGEDNLSQTEKLVVY